MAAKYASMVADRPKRAASTASRKYPVKATPKVNELTMPTVRPRWGCVGEDAELCPENLGISFCLLPMKRTILLSPTPLY